MASGTSIYDASLLKAIADEAVAAIKQPLLDENISLCGPAPLSIISSHPETVLALAQEKLQTWPYHQVPVEWRRLYEEATLHLLVKYITNATQSETPMLRACLITPTHNFIDKLKNCVYLLDMALIVSGAPGRRLLIQKLLEQLDPVINSTIGDPVSEMMQPEPSAILFTDNSIHRVHELNIASFQHHLDATAGPIIMSGTIEHWPARHLWKDVGYLRRRTLCGFRLFPIEIGSSYTDEDWSQKMMPFNDFADTFLIPNEPGHIGYLAQHDVFTQVPALRSDITIPDFCWASPKRPTGAAALTPGLSDTIPMDEPNLNAWLGPKGTRTPLHTDPYHNIFCQVVGYKYVRLYAPEEAQNLYPSTVDDAGINMSNTSQVDIFKHRPGRALDRNLEQERLHENQKFPRFRNASYQEAILAPGDCLYVPLGWWHYVEALSTSFSVSFWWN